MVEPTKLAHLLHRVTGTSPMFSLAPTPTLAITPAAPDEYGPALQTPVGAMSD